MASRGDEAKGWAGPALQGGDSGGLPQAEPQVVERPGPISHSAEGTVVASRQDEVWVLGHPSPIHHP